MRPEFYRSTIREVVDLGAGRREYLCDVPEGLSWQPGSHAHTGLPGFQEGGKPHRELVHNMSICTLESEGALGFATRLTSSDSAYKATLAGLGPGDEVTFFRASCGLALPEDGRAVVLLSQGVALAALRPVILDAAARNLPGTPSLVSISVDAAGELFAGELAQAAASSAGITLVHVAHRAELEAAVRALAAPSERAFTVVGSDAFVRAQVALLRELGVPDESIVVDRDPRHRAPLFA